ncbi:MAG: DegT/DnrJ/EryC1/StrS family aminotransferase [Sphaerochaetaceae bacterium]
MEIALEKPTIRRKDMSAVLQTMADEQIGVGEHTKTFSELLKETLGIQGYSIAVRDYVYALRLALLALQLPPDGVVGISALSPLVYTHVLTSLGLQFHIFDIDSENGNVALEKVTNFNGRLDALILYEPYGNCLTTAGWRDLPFPIIEDISESIGSCYEEIRSGSIGEVVICSFEDSAVVSTAGGAAVLTASSEIESRLISLSALELPYVALGDLNAALGIVQVGEMEKNIAKRGAIFNRYRLSLMKSKHALFGINEIDYRTNGHAFVVTLDGKAQQAQKFCLKNGVNVAFAFENRVIKGSLERYDQYPQAIVAVNRSLRFPLYPFLSKEQISQVEKVLAHLP